MERRKGEREGVREGKGNKQQKVEKLITEAIKYKS